MRFAGTKRPELIDVHPRVHHPHAFGGGPQAFDDGRLLGLADRDDPVRLLGDQALAGIASG
ncbi:hypothetical protein SDC9_150209 [bioreactor metagenome]|uniref:Uncharacterized protein n=1 Tax=bioreactor metagenome TaxID=1076179 RepID=A0A645ELU8_9ZZZZ